MDRWITSNHKELYKSLRGKKETERDRESKREKEGE